MFGLRKPLLLGLIAVVALVLGLFLPVVAEQAGIIFGYSNGVTTILSVVVALVAAAVSYFMYEGTGQLLSTPWRLGLAAFRFLVLLVAGMMLLEPRLELTRKQSAPPVVTILHDDSESLINHGDSTFVKTQYPGLLKSFVEKLSGDQFATHFLSFGPGLVSNQSPDSLRYNRPGTNISEALEQTAQRYGNQNLGAVVLISDGISTAGTNPLYSLGQFQQPIYTILIGDTTPQRDVRIAEVLYNEIAYLENETPLKVKVNMTGFEQADLKVVLSSGGKELGSQNLAMSRSMPFGEVDFVVKPERTGIQQYNISVQPIAGELTTRNNSRSIFIKVLETKVKIALLAGYPHPDLGALRQTLEGDDRYELKEFIHLKPNSYYEDPAKANFGEFDLFILHNFPFSSGDAAMLERVKNEVEGRKTPFIAIIGQNTHLPTLQNGLGTYMALVPGAIQSTSEEAQMVFKSEYQEHSTFTFDAAWMRLMSQAPPLVRNQSEWKAAGDAKVFATARIKNIVVDYPIYALRSFMDRKSMVLVGENIWRMRQHAQLETGEYTAFDDWIYNNIQWLMVREDKRKFKVSSSKNLYNATETVLFRGEAYDDSYKPLSGVDIKLTLKRPSGKEDVVYLNEAGNARYFLELNNMEEGNYSYTAEGKKNDVKVGTDRGEFSVGKSNIEHFNLTADLPLMQQIALRTSGKFAFARNMDQVADDILQLNSLKPVVSYITKRIGFNEYPWIFAVLLGLLALEWAVRKVFSLS